MDGKYINRFKQVDDKSLYKRIDQQECLYNNTLSLYWFGPNPPTSASPYMRSLDIYNTVIVCVSQSLGLSLIRRSNLLTKINCKSATPERVVRLM